MPLCCISIRVDRSNGIPFNDECFDHFEGKLTVSTNDKYLDIEIDLDLHSYSNEDASKFLEAFAQSNLFQNHAKKVYSLSLTSVWTDKFNWKQFFEKFAQNQSTLKEFKLSSADLTDGAQIFGWALDNEKSGLKIKSLEFEEVKGSKEWIDGLYKNTSLTKMTIMGKHCDRLFDFFRKCDSLDRFEQLRYGGLINFEGTRGVSIQLGYDDTRDHWAAPPNKCEEFSFGMAYSKTGNVSLVMSESQIQAYEDDVEDYAENQDEYEDDKPVKQSDVNLELFWETFCNLLNFRKEQPIALRLNLRSLRLEGCELVFRDIATRKIPIKLLIYYFCNLTEEYANDFGWLLDTETSGVNVERVRFFRSRGSCAWASGLYKNKTLKYLHLEGFCFLYSIAHYLRYGKASNLEILHFFGIQEETDRKPHDVDDETLASIDNSVDPNQGNLASLKEINFGGFNLDISGFGFYQNFQIRFPKIFCESMGSVLRSASNLKTLKVCSVGYSQYDFLKDARSCHEISLTNSYFQPSVIVSLINNDDAKLKSLGLEGYQTDTDTKKVVKVLEETDLTLLDELCIGRYMSQNILVTLYQQFNQSSNGPRKFTRHFERGNHQFESQIEDNLVLEGLGRSLAGNTRIEEIKLEVALRLDPDDMLGFLHNVCQMPSLKKLQVSDVFEWQGFEDDEDEEKAEECNTIVLRELLKRNATIDISKLWKNDDEQFSDLLESYRHCKTFLGCKSNELMDGLWPHLFAHVNLTSSWWSDRDTCMKKKLDVLFYLVGQVPRLFQQAGDQAKHDNEGPRFIVPHHPDCPACHKRQKVVD